MAKVITIFILLSSAALILRRIRLPNHSNEAKPGSEYDRDGTSSSSSNHPTHKHIIPTLFAIEDHRDGTLLNALTNPLYDDLKSSTFRRPYDSESLLKIDGNNKEPASKQYVALKLHFPPIPNLDQPESIIWTDKEVISPGSPFTILWKDVLLNDDDIFTVHCPPENESYVDAALVIQAKRSESPLFDNPGISHWHISSFPVIHHPSCQFRLWRRHPSNNLVLLSETNHIEIRIAPTGIHLALTSSPDTLNVHFSTGGQGTPVVSFATSPFTDWQKREGTSQTYAADDLCAAPANIEEAGKFITPGMLHVVTLTDLQSDTLYEYKVGLATGSGIIWGEVRTFLSPLPPHTETSGDYNVSFLAYGDQGCDESIQDGGGYNISLAIDKYHTGEDVIRAVHHIGDLAYALGAGHVWDIWMTSIQGFSTGVPLMVSVGNHEYDHIEGGQNGKDPSGVTTPGGWKPEWGNMGNDSGGECGVPTVKRFSAPGGGNGLFWYSYDMGMSHIIALSGEHDMQNGSPQKVWLEEHLATVNKTITPWLIVECHRPLYHSEINWAENAVGLGMREEIEDLLFHYKVDVFLAGHYHSYLRTCNGLYREVCGVDGGTTHITVGTAGAHLDSGMLYEQDWTERFLKEWGIGKVTLNMTHFVWEFIGREEIVLDKLILTKNGKQ